jgi:hypothetical protein
MKTMADLVTAPSVPITKRFTSVAAGVTAKFAEAELALAATTICRPLKFTTELLSPVKLTATPAEPAGAVKATVTRSTP